MTSKKPVDRKQHGMVISVGKTDSAHSPIVVRATRLRLEAQALNQRAMECIAHATQLNKRGKVIISTCGSSMSGIMPFQSIRHAQVNHGCRSSADLFRSCESTLRRNVWLLAEARRIRKEIKQLRVARHHHVSSTPSGWDILKEPVAHHSLDWNR